MLSKTFCNALDLIPNGVLIIDIKSKKITFANKEMESIVGVNAQRNADSSGEEQTRLSEIKKKVCLFFLCD
jgi:nitrogen-specific signal transduction histidine kinase